MCWIEVTIPRLRGRWEDLALSRSEIANTEEWNSEAKISTTAGKNKELAWVP